MSVAGESMMRDLGLSEIQLGYVLSAFAVGYGVFQIPGGLFGSAVGSRRAMTGLALCWGVLTVLTAFAPGRSAAPLVLGLGLLVVTRFLMGVAQAPIYPVTSGVAMVVWLPQTSWGMANGLGTTALTLGAAASAPSVAWLVTHAGWRRSFLVLAPLGFLTAALWWWLFRDDPDGDPRVNAGELALIRKERAPGPADPPRASWIDAVRNRDLLALTASYFCMNYVFYLFFNWFFYYLVDVRGLPRQMGGYFTSAQWMVGAGMAVAGGALGDGLARRLGPRLGYRIAAGGGLLLCAPLLVAGALASHPGAAVALLSLSFGATQLTDGSYWAAAMRIGGGNAAAGTGLLNTGGNVVGGIGAVLVPLLARAFGWKMAISTGALFAVAGALLWLLVRADVPLEAQRLGAR
jgi:ACS family glucarate transporter-like MFS transporter